MKVMFVDDDKMIVKVSESLYYYGNGSDANDFSESPLKWIRFNPYMIDVSRNKIPVPDAISETIKEYEKQTHFAK